MSAKTAHELSEQSRDELDVRKGELTQVLLHEMYLLETTPRFVGLLLRE